MLILKRNAVKPTPALLHEPDDHLWKMQSFLDYAQHGLELQYPGDDITIDTDTPEPFTGNDKAFCFTTGLDLEIPNGSNLLVVSHNSRYLEEGVPEVIPMCWRNWYPQPLIIHFVKRPCRFRKGEPYAQLLIVPRDQWHLTKMTKEDKKAREQRLRYFTANETRYSTRDGNAYNVLSNMDDIGKLPRELAIPGKKLRLV